MLVFLARHTALYYTSLCSCNTVIEGPHTRILLIAWMYFKKYTREVYDLSLIQIRAPTHVQVRLFTRPDKRRSPVSV